MHNTISIKLNNKNYYNYEALINTSRRLWTILHKKLSIESLKDFQDVVFSLDWVGKSADAFREETAVTVSALINDNINPQLIEKLKTLADFPQEYAENMERQSA